MMDALRAGVEKLSLVSRAQRDPKISRLRVSLQPLESRSRDQRSTRGLSKRPRGTSAHTQRGSEEFRSQASMTSIAFP